MRVLGPEGNGQVVWDHPQGSGQNDGEMEIVNKQEQARQRFVGDE